MGKGYFGKYRAEVLNVDDPELRGRVLVKCPKILNNHTLGWAESCFTPGQFFLPRKGDFVWIEFEEGDTLFPIWVGIMPTREYVRDYLNAGMGAYDPLKAVSRSRRHAIRYYDKSKNGNNRMTIIDESGSYLQLNAEEGDIVIRAMRNIVNREG